MMRQKSAVIAKAACQKLCDNVSNGKKRIEDLDILISRTYEDNVLGRINDDRYAKLVSGYEKEQKELIGVVSESEKKLADMDKSAANLKIYKSSGHCHIPIDIYFTAAGLVDIPDAKEIQEMMEKIRENPQEYRLAV